MTTTTTTASTTAAVGFQTPEGLAVGFDDTAEIDGGRWEMCAVIEGVDTRDSQQVRMFRPGSIRFPSQPAALLWQATDSHSDGDPAPAVRVGTIEVFGRDGDQIILSGRYLDTFEAGEFARLVEAGDAGWPSIVVSDDDVIVSEEPAPDMGEGVEVVGDTRAEWIDGLLVNCCVCQTPAQEGTWIRPATAEPVEAEADVVTVTAAGMQLPDPAWFDQPALAGVVPFHVEADGRAFGHIAEWGSCHIGLPDCTTPPPSPTGGAYFATGEVLCSDGSTVAVGQVTLGTGHAPLTAGTREAVAHYDDTGLAVADVCYFEDEHGPLLAGVVRPGLDDGRLWELRAAGVSGDWRRIGGNLELVAVLAVNVPGFPMPRMAARVACGAPQALVAGGLVSDGSGDREALSAAATLRLLAPVALERVGARVGYPERLLARARLAAVKSRLT